MTSKFLHDKPMPVAELVDTDEPRCDACAQLMWLCRVETRITGEGASRKGTYECKRCGASRVVITHRNLPGSLVARESL